MTTQMQHMKTVGDLRAVHTMRRYTCRYAWTCTCPL